jgi:hypothetical protein
VCVGFILGGPYYTYALVEYHHLSKIIIAHIPFF